MRKCRRCGQPKFMHERPRWWQFRYRCPRLIVLEVRDERG